MYGVPACELMNGRLHSTNYNFLLPSLSVNRGKLCSCLQACKSPFSGYHEYLLQPSLPMLVELLSTVHHAALEQHECSTVDCVQCVMLNGKTLTLCLVVKSATTHPLCCKTLFEKTLGELPCLCSAQGPNMLGSLSAQQPELNRRQEEVGAGLFTMSSQPRHISRMRPFS